MNIFFKTLLAYCLFATSANLSMAESSKKLSGLYAGAFGQSSKESVSGLSLNGDRQFIEGNNAYDETANSTFKGSSIGIVLGYRKISENGFFTGIETDISQLNLKGTQETLVDTANSYYGMVGASNTRETKWASTVRLMAGYTYGPWLFNLSGGLALASMNETRTQYRGFLSPTRTEAQFTEESKTTALGLAYGVSGARQLSENISVNADYLVLNFNNIDFNFPDARGGVATSYTSVNGRSIENDMKIKLIRIGLIYSF
jgi:opacity protein-like surface antigen